MEISLDEEFNPIKQDIKNNALRFITYGKSQWNYGSLPQTWEDPDVAVRLQQTVVLSALSPTRFSVFLGVTLQISGTELKGDGDPLDVVELSDDILPRGAVVPVKVVGALSLIDEGELDWKLIAIAECDPMSTKIHDISDVEKHMPGKLDAIREWYRLYKSADGKGLNSFVDEQFADKAKAVEVIEEAHASWAAKMKP